MARKDDYNHPRVIWTYSTHNILAIDQYFLHEANSFRRLDLYIT
jgi:hypothetical protein